RQRLHWVLRRKRRKRTPDHAGQKRSRMESVRPTGQPADRQRMLPTFTPEADCKTAACWVVVTRDGRFPYTSNTGSGNVSGYKVSFGDALRLLNIDGLTPDTAPR